MAEVIHLTESSFDGVVAGGKPVLVDFWAEWCGPCKMISPVMDELANELDGQAIIAKVNVDEEPGLAASFGVASIPNLKVFKAGQEVENVVGAVPKATLLAALKKHI